MEGSAEGWRESGRRDRGEVREVRKEYWRERRRLRRRMVRRIGRSEWEKEGWKESKGRRDEKL